MVQEYRCSLSGLENPMLNDIILGLKFDKGFLEAKENIFRCCEGTGFNRTHANNNVTRCGIQSRIERVNTLLLQFFKTWGADQKPPFKVTPDTDKKALTLVSDMLRSLRPQASIVSGRPNKPGDIWPMAIASLWRFDLDAHVINLKKDALTSRWPFQDSTLGKTQVIFIEQADGLSNITNLTYMEAIINYVYQSNCFLWIEDLNPTAQDKGKPKAGDDFMAAIEHRISRKKNKPLRTAIDRHCLSKLSTLERLPRISY